MASTPELLYWDTSVPEWKIVKAMVLPVVAAPDLVEGSTYTILKVGDTSWTSLGASANTVGVSFLKNATTPTGTGTANGPGVYTGKNPILRVNIVDTLGAAREAKITIANTALKPNTDGSSTDPTINPQIGMFSNFFKPFTAIRIRDSATMHILFAGEIYKVHSSFSEGEYGSTISLDARDALADLQRNTMAYLEGSTASGAAKGEGLNLISVTGTSGTHYWRRSEIIKFLIREGIWKGGDASAQSLVYSSTDLFHDSEENFTRVEAEDNYEFKNKNLTALQHIASLGSQDWYEDAGGTKVYGYDYYAHPYITSVLKTVAPPPMMLAYHKRLSEPTVDPLNYGAKIRYQARNKQGTVNEQTFRMLDDYNFNDLSNETFTHVAAEYLEYENVDGDKVYDQEAYGGDFEDDYTGTELKVENSLFTIIYCDIPTSGTPAGTASGNFKVSNVASGAPLLNITQASPLYTDAAGAAANDKAKLVGHVQYQSGTGDDQYIIISHAVNSLLKGITSGSLYEAGVVGGITYGNGVIITLSGQKIVSTTLGRIRTKRMDLKNQKNLEVVRKDIAATLVNATGGDPVQRGYFRIADFPHVKWSGTANSSSSGNNLYTDQNTGQTGGASGVGFEQGHTVTHKAGAVLYAGQISSVVANYQLTVPMYRVDTLESGSPATRNWADGNEYTVYVPLRAGQTVFVDNRLIPIYGIHLIIKTMYSWQNGYVVTDFETLGRNEARGGLVPEYGDLGNTSSAVDKTMLPQNPKGVVLENLEWLYTDYNTLGWRPVGGTGVSTLRITAGGSYKIAASNTDTILTAASMTSPMAADKTYILYFDYQTSKTQFQIAITEPAASKTYVPKSHFVVLGWITIGDNKDGGRVNFIKNFGVDSDFSPLNIAAPKILTPNSLAATLLGKTMQPYTHNLTIKVGDADGANAESKVTVSGGTITFADGTTASVSQTVLTGLTSAGDVRYIYFSIGALHKTTEAATIAWSNSYLNATSDLKGLLAIATKPVDFTTTTDGDSPYFNDGIAQDNSTAPLSVMTFKGHTDTLSVNLLAARAITSRHITTGQIVAKDFRTAAGVATGASGSPGGMWFNQYAIRGLSGGTGAYGNPSGANNGDGDITVNGNQIEFELRASTGKAYFAGGKIMLDCDGVNVFAAANQTVQVSQLDGGGLKLNASVYPLSFNTDVTTQSSVGHIQTDLNSTGSITYGSHSDDRLVIFSDKLDIVLEASNQDIGLFPDSTHGYVKIGQSKGLAFIDSDSATAGMHDSSTDWVGLTGPASSVTNSTMYILPEVITSDDEKFLKITSITGDGSIATPYLATLDWSAAAGGGGGDGIKYFNAGGSDSGYTWTATEGDEAAENAEDRMYFVGGNGITLWRNTNTGPATPAIKWDLSATVSSAHTFSGNNTYSGTSTFTGGSFLVNSGTIRLGDATTDLMEVYATGTYIGEQKYQGTILLQEEASSGSYGNAPSGYGRLYVKQETPSRIYYKTSGGTETPLSSDAFKNIQLVYDSGFSWSSSGTCSADGAEDTLKVSATSEIQVQRNDTNTNAGAGEALRFSLNTTLANDHNFTGDILLYGDYVGIGANSATTELRFYETSGSGGHHVGFLPPTSIAANVIWTLPETDGDANDVLKTDGNGNLDWVTNSGSGEANEDSFRVITPAADGGSAVGGSITANTTTDLLTVKAGTGITLTGNNTNDEASLKIEATHAAFKTFTIGTDIYGSDWASSVGSEVAASAEDTLFLIPSGSVILERITTSETGFKWSLAPTVTTAHTWSNTQTFTGGSFLVNSNTIRLGDDTTDLMNVYSQGTFISVQKFDATILLDEEASAGSYGTPPSGYGRLYVKEESAAHIYFKNDSGTEFDLTGTSSWNIAAESGSTTAISNGDDVRFRASSPAILITRVNNDIYLNHGNTSDLADTNHSGQTFIQNLEFDQYGHVDGYSVGTASSGTVTSVSAGTGMSFTTITGAGAVAHSTADGYSHIPAGGSGSSGSRQVLTYAGVSGTGTWQDADEHGTHGGGHTHSSSLDIAADDIDADGDITCDTLAVVGGFSAGNGVLFNDLSSSNATYDVRISGTGYLFKYSSSRRYKENIIDLNFDSSRIYDLEPHNFKWKDITKTNSKGETVITIGMNDFGYVAEEVHEILPQLVGYDNFENGDNLPASVHYNQITVLLVEEMKKLRARIEVLEGN